MARKTTSHEDFIMSATGMSKVAVQGRANMLRRKGVKLPYLNRPLVLDELRISQLNSLFQKYDIRRKGK